MMQAKMFEIFSADIVHIFEGAPRGSLNVSCQIKLTKNKHA